MIEVCGIRFSYDGVHNVLEDLNLSLSRGQRIGIYGANGSGKTTLARLLCGLLLPCGGKVKIDGIQTDSDEAIYARLAVALVFQDPNDQIVETTVEREIAFGLKNLGLEPEEIEFRIDQCLRLLGLESFRKRTCESLSAGEKQLLNIASVLAMRPKYIILDEPTSLLDFYSRKVFLDCLESVLEKTDAGLIFITARIDELLYCTDVALLDKGRLSFLGKRSDFLQYLLGAEIQLDGGCLLFKKIARVFPKASQLISQSDRLDAQTLVGLIDNLSKDLGGD